MMIKTTRVIAEAQALKRFLLVHCPGRAVNSCMGCECATDSGGCIHSAREALGLPDRP